MNGKNGRIRWEALIAVALLPWVGFAQPRPELGTVKEGIEGTEARTLGRLACRVSDFREHCGGCGGGTVRALRSVEGDLLDTPIQGDVEGEMIFEALGETGAEVNPEEGFQIDDGADDEDDEPVQTSSRPQLTEPRLVEFGGCDGPPVTAAVATNEENGREEILGAAQGLSLATCRTLTESAGFDDVQPGSPGDRQLVVCRQSDGQGGAMLEAIGVEDEGIERLELRGYRYDLPACDNSTYEVRRLSNWRVIDGRLVVVFEVGKGRVPERFEDLCEARQAGYSIWEHPRHEVTVLRVVPGDYHVHAPTHLVAGLKLVVHEGGGFDHPSLPGGRD